MGQTVGASAGATGWGAGKPVLGLGPRDGDNSMVFGP